MKVGSIQAEPPDYHVHKTKLVKTVGDEDCYRLSNVYLSLPLTRATVIINYTM